MYLADMAFVIERTYSIVKNIGYVEGYLGHRRSYFTSKTMSTGLHSNCVGA